MTYGIEQNHLPIWQAARPFLDVRDNDVHTLYAYGFTQSLMQKKPTANKDVIGPAILLHDIGWKKIPQEKILQSFGPNKKYPELERQHEVEGANLATEILNNLNVSSQDSKDIIDIIDGHDTRKTALNINDEIVKDADKLWRISPHGIVTISDWFEQSHQDTIDMLPDHIFPFLFTEEARAIARGLFSMAIMTLEKNKRL